MHDKMSLQFAKQINQEIWDTATDAPLKFPSQIEFQQWQQSALNYACFLFSNYFGLGCMTSLALLL